MNNLKQQRKKYATLEKKLMNLVKNKGLRAYPIILLEKETGVVFLKIEAPPQKIIEGFKKDDGTIGFKTKNLTQTRKVEHPVQILRNYVDYIMCATYLKKSRELSSDFLKIQFK
jgi:hypothetical protein